MATKRPGGIIKKDPNAVEEPYIMDWTALLDELGETITGSDWLVTGPDTSLSVVAKSIVTGAKKTQMKYSGGTLGVTYTLTNRITTSSGYIDDRSVSIIIGEK